MNPELEHQLQAWVDGQLPPDEARELAARVERDPALRALADNLRSFSRLLKDHEPVRGVPDSREFYWSRIRQGIERAGAAAAPAPESERAGGAWLRWLAWMVPAAGAALALVAFLSQPSPQEREARPVAVAEAVEGPRAADRGGPGNLEVESPSDQLTTLTFYSAQDAMTVVWLGRVDLL